MGKVVGLDAGQGWVKVCTSVGDRKVKRKFPTMVEPYVLTGRETGDEVIVDLGGRTYRLFKRSKLIQGRDFYFSSELKALLLYVLSEFPYPSVHVVTGLPPGYATKENRERFRRELEGAWEISVNGEKRRVRIEKCDVKMQAWGGVVRYFSEKGPRELLVLDIGFYTLDAMEFLKDYGKNAIVPDVATAYSSEKGVKYFLDLLMDGIYRRTGERIEDYRLLEEIAQKRKFRGISFEQEVKEARRYWVEAVLDEILRRFRGNVYRYEEVLLIGGGAHLFGVELKFGDRKVPVAKLDEYANVEGFWIWGVSRTGRGSS